VRARWYSSGVVATLTLGLTLATVAFAVVDGVLFRPLPYASPGELVLFHAGVSSAPRREPPLVSWHEAETWKEAIPEVPLTVIAPDPSPYETIRGREYAAAAIDERFFDVIGARPLLGGFSAEDFDFSWIKNPVALCPTLIGYRVWRHTYGGDPAIVGRPVITRVSEGRQYGIRIAGVLPDGLLMPVDGREIGGLRPLRRLQSPSPRVFQIVARLPSASASGAVRDRLLEATRRLALLGEPPPPSGHSPGEPRQPFDDVRLVPIPCDHRRISALSMCRPHASLLAATASGARV
jgi:putative ABC transport system permease protein